MKVKYKKGPHSCPNSSCADANPCYYQLLRAEFSKQQYVIFTFACILFNVYGYLSKQSWEAKNINQRDINNNVQYCIFIYHNIELAFWLLAGHSYEKTVWRSQNTTP